MSAPPRKRGVVTRLKDGENAAVGWQFAPRIVPERFRLLVERSMKKAIKRKRYERQFKRRASQVTGDSNGK